MAKQSPIILPEDPALLSAVVCNQSLVGIADATLVQNGGPDSIGAVTVTTQQSNNIYTTTVNEVESQNFYNINTGPAGPPGVPGTPGMPGSIGPTGFTGAPGAPGAPGPAGVNGESGFSGFSGWSGLNGYNGTSGTSGWSGFSGTGITIGGLNTYVQFNNLGALAGSSSFTWNNSTNRLSVAGTEEVGPIHESFSQVSPAELTITITFFGPPINAYSTNITIVSGGSGFTIGQQIYVPGTSLGGVSPANDRLLTVTGIGSGGSISVITINNDPAPVVGSYSFNPFSSPANTNIWYLSKGVSSINVSSINLTQNYCTNFLLVITQGANPLVPNSFSIDGTNITLMYPGGTPITGTASSTDVVNISVFRTGASTYTALAQVVSFA